MSIQISLVQILMKPYQSLSPLVWTIIFRNLIFFTDLYCAGLFNKHCFWHFSLINMMSQVSMFFIKNYWLDFKGTSWQPLVWRVHGHITKMWGSDDFLWSYLPLPCPYSLKFCLSNFSVTTERFVLKFFRHDIYWYEVLGEISKVPYPLHKTP